MSNKMVENDYVTKHPSLGDGLDGPFDAIRPYEPEEMKQAFEDLLADRQFNVVMKGFAPWLPKGIRNGALRLAFKGVKTPLDFQKRFMKPIVKHIIRKHTDGCTFDDTPLQPPPLRGGLQHCDSPSMGGGRGEARYTFVSNHRDIVLDSAFLDVLLIDANYPTTVEIGIGDNLLIYPWIKRLVRMNKAFTVRRGLTPKEMLASSQLMSRYIHYAVMEKKENIWIAQREGRAKDSDDRTQESVLKMLAMGGSGKKLAMGDSGKKLAMGDSVIGGFPADSLADLNIVPLTISYEYDPCDYLKAQEFQQKRDNPAFKKSKQDDLDNMKTGIFGYKGCVHYHCGQPINAWLDELKDLPRNEFFAAVAQRMDQEIHRGYCLYPCNYIAADMLADHETYESHYTPADKARFEQYLAGQIAKISIPNKDEAFLRERILTMYANPLFNKLRIED